MKQNPVATCKQGQLEGSWRKDVMSFQGVPYASFEKRFAPAGPAPAWEGVRDAHGPAPAFPQIPGPYKARIDGEKIVIEQREDAFVLNIWTPGTELGPQGGRPVVFWIHGGGWTTGSCAGPEYEGATLSARGDLVFVGVNYRLGALSNLHLPGITTDNLAMHDLMAAFEWVRENIASFGGDPERITITGQSAGAWFALALAGMPELKGRFGQLALLSAPGDGPVRIEDAERLAAALVSELGLDDPHDIMDIPHEKIVRAQWKASRTWKGPGIAFMPNIEDGLLPADLIGRAIEVSGTDIPLLDGITTDECAFFLAEMHDDIEKMDEGALAAMASGFACGDGRAALERFSFIDDPYDLMVRIFSNRLFHEPGERLAGGFDTAFAYRMNHKAPAPHLGSCHCVDMSFLFGNLEQWINEPFVKGETEESWTDLMTRFNSAFISFVHTGDPRCAEMPDWPVYGTESDRVVFE